MTEVAGETFGAEDPSRSKKELAGEEGYESSDPLEISSICAIGGVDREGCGGAKQGFAVEVHKVSDRINALIQGSIPSEVGRERFSQFVPIGSSRVRTIPGNGVPARSETAVLRWRSLGSIVAKGLLWLVVVKR